MDLSSRFPLLLYVFRSLKNRRLRSYLTIIGVFIGVASVVSLIGLGEGLRTAIMSQFGISSLEILTVQASGNLFGPPGVNVIKPLTNDDVEAIERLNGVKQAIARLIHSAKMEFNDKLNIVMVGSVPDGDDRDFVYNTLELKPLRGRMLKDGDTKKVIIGYNYYADKSEFGKSIDSGDTVLIQGTEFEVAGILKKKGSFIFDNSVFMNERDMKDLFEDIDDNVNIIIVDAVDRHEIDKVKEDVEKLLRKRRKVKEGEEDFTVKSPKSVIQTLDKILVGVQIFVIIIAVLSIIVGSIGIINTMFTTILERKSQIGVMKAIGAKNKDIFLIFLLESGLLGFLGGVIGTLFGISMAYLGTLQINKFVGATTHPTISVYLVVGALLGSFIIGAISGVVPALRAAKQDPIDAIRG